MLDIPERTIRMRALDDKNDYTLWILHVDAAIGTKCVHTVLDNTRQNAADRAILGEGEEATPEVLAHLEGMRQASNIIVGAVINQALRVLRAVAVRPVEMLAKLQQRFDSCSTASKFSKTSELVSKKFN